MFTFEFEDVVKLLNHCDTLSDHYDPASSRKAEPGLLFVGDDGVYLMPNGVEPAGSKNHVVYSRECNPQTMEFDDWWSYKGDRYGGDDGVDFFTSTQLRDAIRLGQNAGHTRLVVQVGKRFISLKTKK